MRNWIPAFVAATLLATVQLACSGAPTSAEGDGSGSASPDNGAPPSQDLASANASAGGGNSAAFARTGASTTIGASNTDIPVDRGAGSSGGTSGGGTVDPNGGAGPKPTASCSVSKDADGFFTRSSSKSSYVAYVPASYDGSKPVRLIVGLHGCGDTAYNFATWGVNPYDTRGTQQHIGISIGGQDGNCWNLGVDDDKVLAAVDDISKCFWVHPKKVAIAGFSSGGQLAYRVGLMQASRFAAILIEDSGLYAADNNPDALLANASWKVHVAHRTHTSDPVFPLAQVKADWVKTKAAGFPLLTSETPGGHDGVSQDWATWLIPQSAAWIAP